MARILSPSVIGGILILFTIIGSCHASNVTDGAGEEKCSRKAKACSEDGGVIFPAWKPIEDISTATTILRAIVYFVALCYMFLGVSKIADLFMEAIEVITSTTVVQTVKGENGEEKEVEVQIWNETVANLTLMALGSSAPEILLSVIEIVGNNFEAGELGPGTIVGSAAFNLFIITGICVAVIPDGTGKSVKNFGVFACTASWSIAAYIWLYLMIAVITKEKIDWWEGLITLMLFVAFIIMSYTIDRKNEACALGFRYVGIYDPEDDSSSTQKVTPSADQTEKIPLNDVENGTAALADNPRNEKMAEAYSKIIAQKMSTKEKIMARLKEVSDQNPAEPDMWQKTVEQELKTLIFAGRSRAYFRIHKADVNREVKRYQKFLAESVSQLRDIKKDSASRNVIFCADSKVKFAESCGTGVIVVERVGPFVDFTTTRVQYAAVESESATHAATAGKDFKTVDGWLEFSPGETKKTIEVVIYDDPDFEEDEEFVVKIFEVKETLSGENSTGLPYMEPKLQKNIITCVIVDDDHHGKFCFVETKHTVSVPSASASIAERVYKVEIERSKGCRGTVRVPYEIVPDSNCVGGKHFTIAGKAELVFEEKQYQSHVEIEVLPFEEIPPGGLKLKLVLCSPEVIKDKSEIEEAKPEIVEDLKECIVSLVPSMGASVYEELKEKAETNWGKRIKENLCMATDPQPSMMDYVMHFLQMPFTLIFCLVPPPGIAGGWAAFFVAILFIGGMTAVIGDLASGFGCTVGLKDTVTAITLVALGTSLPDTFASKVAAVNDKYADSSVGNVTGSNAVNVFLGVGVAWFVAAVYHEVKGTPEGFEVPEGSLGLSVTTFVILAVVCISTLVVRRIAVKTELGGPTAMKYATACFFVLLWVTYILVSVLNAYCVIESPI